MSYINWDFAQKSAYGRGSRTDIMGKIYYRDKNSKKSKTSHYSISFYKSAPDVIREAETVVVGTNGDDVFISTKDMPNVPKFNVSNSSTSVSVYGEDLIRKIVDTLTGLDPDGDLVLTYNLEKVDKNTFKFVDIEIE